MQESSVTQSALSAAEKQKSSNTNISPSVAANVTISGSAGSLSISPSDSSTFIQTNRTLPSRTESFKKQPQIPVLSQQQMQSTSTSSQRKIQPQPPKLIDTQSDDSLYMQSPLSSPRLVPKPSVNINKNISNSSNASSDINSVNTSPRIQPLSNTLGSSQQKSDHQPATKIQPTKRQPSIPVTSAAQSSLSETIQSTMLDTNSSVSGNQKPIDPILYNALQDTNDALKIEVQRMAIFEQKCLSLEKEVKTLQKLKDENIVLENELKTLQDLREENKLLERELKTLNQLRDENRSLEKELKLLQNVQEENKNLERELKTIQQLKEENRNLEQELKTLKQVKDENSRILEKEIQDLEECKVKLKAVQDECKQWRMNKEADEEKYRQMESNLVANMEKLENENASLKNKLRDLDKLLEEYEAKCNQSKTKESQLEEKVKHLEAQLISLEENTKTSEMHEHKLIAYEQANRILEQELEQLKEQQKQERAKVKEKMELLVSKQNEKIKKLEETNHALGIQLNQMKESESSLVHSLNEELEQLKSHLKDLEPLELENNELRKQINQVKIEMSNQMALIAMEKKKIEIEKNDINDNYMVINESRMADGVKHQREKEDLETRIKQLSTSLEHKENEMVELRKVQENKAIHFLNKLNLLNEENLELANKLKNTSDHQANSSEELNKLKRKLLEMSSEHDKLQAQLKSFEKLENELIDIHMKNTNSKEVIQEMEAKIQDWERRYNKEIGEYKNLTQSQQQQIKQLKQQLTAESLKVESANTDYSLVKLELNKVDTLKLKCESLERELNSARATAAAALQNNNKLINLPPQLQPSPTPSVSQTSASSTSRYDDPSVSYDKYYGEIKIYQAQLTSLVSATFLTIFFS